MLPAHEIVSSIARKFPLIKKLKKNRLIRYFNNKVYQNYINNRCIKVQQYGYEAISQLTETSDNLGIELWIDWGTLLGFIREKAIIKHDYDLDFGTWKMNNHEHKKFSKELEHRGFILVREFKENEELVLETFDYKGVLVDIDYNIKTDTGSSIYMFEIDQQTIITQTNQLQTITGMRKYRYDMDNFMLEKKKFYNGTECYIPVDEMSRILKLYGENWNIPDKNFDWHSLQNYTDEGFSINFTGWRKK